jgi:hypothetical protein
MLIAAIDAEIARLLEVRRLLSEREHLSPAGRKQNRRPMSLEARARMAEGQRRRWAAYAKARENS